MLVRQKKQISGQQPSSSSVSDSTPQFCLWRRPPSTPPLTLRTQKLIAWQPSTDLLLHGSLKGKGHGSDVRDSWPSTLKTIYDLKPGKTQRSMTPSTKARCVRKTPPPFSQPHPFGRTIRLSPPPDANHSCDLSVPDEAPPIGLRSLSSFCCSVFRDRLVPMDDKIKQAVDLMKSHLMMVVRKEAELLRDQITELTYRNQQLQRENHILKAIIQNTNLTI